MVTNISYYINLSKPLGWTNALSGQQIISWPPIQLVKLMLTKIENQILLQTLSSSGKLVTVAQTMLFGEDQRR